MNFDDLIPQIELSNINFSNARNVSLLIELIMSKQAFDNVCFLWRGQRGSNSRPHA